MNLIIDCPDGTMRFKDARGRAWNPNDPDMILAIEDIPNRPRPGQFPGSSSQGGANFLNLMNLYNTMQETLQVSKNAYSLGQSSSTRIGGMERNILSMQHDITYIRDHMVVKTMRRRRTKGSGWILIRRRWWWATWLTCRTQVPWEAWTH
ncbi:hypothetical protein Hanom_Chr13g01217641 [Helianthus anomalus]